MEAIDYSLLYHCTGKDLTFGKLFLCKILIFYKYTGLKYKLAFFCYWFIAICPVSLFCFIH